MLTKPQPWVSETPRLVGVNAFGFGGINAHLIVEEYRQAPAVNYVAPLISTDEPIVVTGTASVRYSQKDEIAFPLGIFRIPPTELAEMLPQQTILLQALHMTVGTRDLSGPCTGIFVGAKLDINTTNFHVRWALEQLENERFRDIHPPLTANRTMGALASVASSRIARHLRAGGPSYTICAGNESGWQSMQNALTALRRGEIDTAVVCAVDCQADERFASTESGKNRAAVILLQRESVVTDAKTILCRLSPTALFPKLTAPTCVEQLDAWINDISSISQRVSSAGNIPHYWLTNSGEVRQRGAFSENQHFVRSSASVQPLIFTFSGNQPAEILAQLRALDCTEPYQALWNKLRKYIPDNQLCRLAFVAHSQEKFRSHVQQAISHLDNRPQVAAQGPYWYVPRFGASKLAFVYPGSGNHFAGMGRDFSIAFPQVLDQQQLENNCLRDQYCSQHVWESDTIEQLSPKDLIFAQVALGTLISDSLRLFHVRPDAAIGYSLGESASMFGLRAWTTRDLMFRRISESSLFTHDLAGNYAALRKTWGFSDDQPLEWCTGVVTLPPEKVLAELKKDEKAYLLIINTPTDCVIGGERAAVERLANRLNTTFIEIKGVTSAHCADLASVREPYWQLHHLPTQVPEGVSYYSGVWGKSYDLNADSAADAITSALLHTIDFPKVIQQAYQDGVRTFLEIGPGDSCKRMINRILNGAKDIAVRSLCTAKQQNLEEFWETLAMLFVRGHEVKLDDLHHVEIPAPKEPVLRLPAAFGFSLAEENKHVIYEKDMNRERTPVPAPPRMEVAPPVETRSQPQAVERAMVATATETTVGQGSLPVQQVGKLPADWLLQSQIETIAAHDAYLRWMQSSQEFLAHHRAYSQSNTNYVQFTATTGLAEQVSTDLVPRHLTYEQCVEFARGQVGKVLGRRFAEIDRFPTRVRLPDGPLMLVDRILAIEGEPLSMSHGRVVTEHTVHAGRWYLDAGRIPTCVAVEAGQADLFLSGYLGIDFQTNGLACYRLLDATITFHRGLPVIGDRIEYDIFIDQFFQQGSTYLFRFRFESTVNGEPLLSMQQGCAGFFTDEELASGKGIVHTALDRRPQQGKLPPNWQPYAGGQPTLLNRDQVNALRAGDYRTAFGEEFAHLLINNPMKLPQGMLKLVDSISAIDFTGGKYGCGLIRGEADIHPDDWYLTCHFVDDQVMPGTLMYECCLHTLRILMMRLGFVGEADNIVCEPLPGVMSKLKCRGQVIASTRQVTYQVVVKEIGFEPSAYVIGDALMYADGKPIVEITNMSMRMTGLTEQDLQRVWQTRQESPIKSKQPIFDDHHITAFATGKPSEAFGDRYRIFDQERVIARLPGEPYKFLNRIIQIDNCRPWEMVAGGQILAEYDFTGSEWYFGAENANRMPYCVLLEAALQPCGWLAGYLGSALTSDIDLSFRNLGGTAVQLKEVLAQPGTFTTAVKMTRVSSSGGMIIQHYDFDLQQNQQSVLRGNTYFGFFTKAALANQVGLKDLRHWHPTVEESPAVSYQFPVGNPFPDKQLRMIDAVQFADDPTGKYPHGVVTGTVSVDPSAWFFQAHFYQDPVWPGSLGLESMLQLMKWFAHQRWGSPKTGWQCTALGKQHEWVYRGQILPTDHRVTVQVFPKIIDDSEELLVADGLLSVDGRMIYQMKDFSLQRA